MVHTPHSPPPSLFHPCGLSAAHLQLPGRAASLHQVERPPACLQKYPDTPANTAAMPCLLYVCCRTHCDKAKGGLRLLVLLLRPCCRRLLPQIHTSISAGGSAVAVCAHTLQLLLLQSHQSSPRSPAQPTMARTRSARASFQY